MNADLEVSSAKTLHIVIPSGGPFMKIKNKRGSNTDPCDTREFIFLLSDVWPFNTTLW